MCQRGRSGCSTAGPPAGCRWPQGGREHLCAAKAEEWRASGTGGSVCIDRRGASEVAHTGAKGEDRGPGRHQPEGERVTGADLDDRGGRRLQRLGLMLVVVTDDDIVPRRRRRRRRHDRSSHDSGLVLMQGGQQPTRAPSTGTTFSPASSIGAARSAWRGRVRPRLGRARAVAGRTGAGRGAARAAALPRAGSRPPENRDIKPPARKHPRRGSTGYSTSGSGNHSDGSSDRAHKFVVRPTMKKS